jgi:hypothetical protein
MQRDTDDPSAPAMARQKCPKPIKTDKVPTLGLKIRPLNVYDEPKQMISNFSQTK